MANLNTFEKKEAAIEYLFKMGLIDIAQYYDILGILGGQKTIVVSKVSGHVIDEKECAKKVVRLCHDNARGIIK